MVLVLYLMCVMASLVMVTHASNESFTNVGGGPMSPSPSIGSASSGGFHLSPGANVQQPDNFHPSIAVIIAILSTMFALTFLLLLYAKHCKQPQFSVYGGSDLSILPMAAAHPQMADDPAQPLFMTREAAGLDPFVIESLPSFPFSLLRGTKDGLECAVCLSRFANHELLRLLPSCHHAFHTHCVDTWLAHHSTCPLCRRHVGLDSLLLLESSFGLRPPSSEPPSLRQSFRFPLADAVTSGNGNGDHALEYYVERDPGVDDGDGSSRLGLGSSSRFTIGSSNRHIASAVSGSNRHGWSGSWRKDLLICGGSGRVSSRINETCLGGSIRKLAGTSAREHPIHETIVEDPERIICPLTEVGGHTVDAPLRVREPDNALSKHEIPIPFCHELPLHLQHMDEELARRLSHRVTMSNDLTQSRRWSDVVPSHGVSYFFMQRDRHFGGNGGIIDGDGCTRVSNNLNNNVVVDVETGETEFRSKFSALGESNNIQRRCMSEIPGLHRSTMNTVGERRLPDGDQLDMHRRRWIQTTRRTLKCLVGRHYMPNPSVLGDDPSCNADGPTANITKS